MKQSLFLFAALIFIVSFCSCKKDYSCKCTLNSGSVVSPITIHNTKGAAKKECESWSVGAAGAPNGSTCKLL